MTRAWGRGTCEAARVIQPFIRHASEELLRTSIFTVRQDLAEHPKSGRRGKYLVLEQPDWVNVVALSPGGELIMVRQWRHGTRAVELEVPAGVIDPGESPLEAAARELREETGYVAAQLELIGSVAPNPAFASNTCFTVLARDCTLVGEQELDEGEDIEVELFGPERLEAALAAGEIRNAMAICALFWVRRQSEQT